MSNREGFATINYAKALEGVTVDSKQSEQERKKDEPYTVLPDVERIKPLNMVELERILRISGIPPAYRKWKLDDFSAIGINVAKIRQAWSECLGFYIHSNTHGAGKSSLAAAMVRDLMHPNSRPTLAKRVAGRWTETDHEKRQQYDVIEGHYGWAENSIFWVNVNSFYEGVKEIMQEAKEARVVIIDDISAARQTEFIWNALRQIVEDRISKEKYIIVTSNLDIPGLTAKESTCVDSGFVSSRLGGLTEIELIGEDRRGKDKKIFVF